MDGFRSIMRGWLGKSLLALIILPFAFVGVEGLFSGGGASKPAIEVNGHEISKQELEQAVENRRQQLLQRMGEGVDPSLVTTDMVKPATIKALIQRQLVVEAAKAEGMFVPPETVKSYVRSLPQFHDDAGVFSQERLERFLVQSGFSAARIFSEVNTDMITEQLQGGISESAFATPSDVSRVLELDKQVRDIALLHIKPDAFKESIVVDDNELNAYFDKHKDAFRTEQKVQLNYLEFTQNDFIDSTAVVTAEQIKAKIDQKVEKVKQSERRRAAHILIEVGDKHSDVEAKTIAENVLADLRKGNEFALIAKEKSEDFATSKQGGDLGFAGRGIYDPAFEEALFGLQENNGLSGVVKSEFGYHVIKLLAIEAQPLPSIDKDRDAMVAEIRSEMAKEKMSLAIDDLNRLAFESGDLSVIADEFKKSVATSDVFSRTTAKGLFSEPKILDVAFSDPILQEQRNSDVVELENGSLIMLRLKSHEPPRQQTLDEVKSRVKVMVVAEMAQQKAKAVADEAVAKLKSGGDKDELTKAIKLNWENNVAVERNSSKITRQVLQKAFEIPKPSTGKASVSQVDLPTGEVVVVLVTNVANKSEDRTDAEKQQFAKGLAYRFGTIDMDGFLATLESNADIVKHVADDVSQ